MNKTYTWTFAIILFFGFFIFAWNDYEIPFSPLTETAETKGKISNIKFVPVEGGHGFLQKVTYYYQIGDKRYSDIKKIGRKYKMQHVGNRVLIEYSTENPEKTKIIGFYNDYKNEVDEVFYSYFKTGYYQITLLNGLFNEFEYGKKGIVISENKGEYLREKDTLILNYFNQDIENKKLSISSIENEKTELTELKTGIKYK